MYLNHFGLGFDLIFSTGFLIQMVIQAFAISHKTLDFSDNPVVNISYLPIIYFGLLIVLSLLVFYNLYSRYAIP